MQAYAAIYPWAAMVLATLASSACLVGGGITAYLIAFDANDSGDRIGSIFGGFVVFILACLGSQFCLYIGGKAVGAF